MSNRIKGNKTKKLNQFSLLKFETFNNIIDENKYHLNFIIIMKT